MRQVSVHSIVSSLPDPASGQPQGLPLLSQSGWHRNPLRRRHEPRCKTGVQQEKGYFVLEVRKGNAGPCEGTNCDAGEW